MSSAFNPFPTGAQVAGPPPRKTVEYGTGIVVSEDGAIVTDRQVTDGCLSIVIAGYRQCRSRRRGQGARSRAAAHLRRARTEAARRSAMAAAKTERRSHRHRRSAKPGRRRCGEQRQGFGRAGRRRRDVALSPAPALGFSGAAALDGDGKFAGIALLKPVLVAGPANAAPAAQAVLVSAGHRARIPQGARRQRIRRIVGCEGGRGARDLRAEIATSLRLAPRACGKRRKFERNALLD